MIEDIIIYILETASLAYVIYRVYSSIKKKQACDKCGLMEAAKKAQKN
jgi:hypothetical protein